MPSGRRSGAGGGPRRAMKYQYLKARGALNEGWGGPAPGSVAPAPAVAWGPSRRIAPEVLALLPEGLVRAEQVIPVAVEGETVTVAAVDPDDIALADKL